MSGLFNTLENKVMGGMEQQMMGNMLGGGNNNNNNNANNPQGTNQGGMGGIMGGNNNNPTGDKYEGMIQQGEGYVKQHYSGNANIMRGEQFVEEADSMRLGRNNMGGMQGGVGGTMSSDPQGNPQAGTNTYGSNGGMGPATGGLQQGGLDQQQQQM